jgi:signal transduction histidine kinase/ligand-binding sensor domain-containing protein
MCRQLAVCLFAFGICIAWLSVQAASNDSLPAVKRSGVAGPVGSTRPADYIRKDFTVEDGLPDNVVNAVVETENGLLWVGMNSGLASFDGREFTPVDLQATGGLAQGAVHSLLESSKGDLWVGTDVGVLRIPKAALDQFSPDQLTLYHLGLEPNDEVEALIQDRDGAIWAGTNHGLYREDSGKFVEVIAGTSFRIAEALDGHLLVLHEARLIEWDGHELVPRRDLVATLDVPESNVFDIYQDRDGTMWYSTLEGIRRRGLKPLPRLRPLAASAATSYRRPVADPEGNLWLISAAGLYRVAGDVMEDTPVYDVQPRCLYIDRVGGVWVGTNGSGLIHLKRRTVRMFTRSEGLSSDIAMAVLSTHDGRLWIGGNCGLSVYDGNRFRSYGERDGLSNSCVWSLAEDKNQDLWIGTYGGGIFRFRDGRFAQYRSEQGLVSNIVAQIIVAHDGSLWIATPDGISHMQNGHFRNYTTRDGLSSNEVEFIHQDRSGAIWVTTKGGIDRFIADRFVPFPTGQSEDRSFSVRFAEDSLGDLYTSNSPKGIGLIHEDQLVAVDEDLKVLEMVESEQHDLWWSGTNGIVRIGLNDLKSSLDSRHAPLDYQLIDRADGLNTIQCSVGSPNMAITPDKKLWVATVKGLAMLDLARLPGTGRKPKVFIGAVTVGKERLRAGSQTVLPPGPGHIELHLSAVDLASPEKVRLQYRLDGVDAGWLDASTSRMAVYTDIPNGSHIFHVRATSSDGVWDRDGITYNITQLPYFYQTIWFRLFCVIGLALLAWQASQWRVRLAKGRVQLQMAERLSERSRIARELHDTLLQSFQGLILNFQRARNLLPGRPDQAMAQLDTALDRAESAIMEGRDAIHDIRGTTPQSGDFTGVISALGEELASEYGPSGAPTFRLVVEGNPKPVSPIVGDEIYRITREALRNAYTHANARNVEAEIRYEEKLLRVRIRDDGIGINKSHLGETGRVGHYGLRGMRERATRIGAQLDVWSEKGAGAEIELRVPHQIAYEADAQRNIEKAHQGPGINVDES